MATTNYGWDDSLTNLDDVDILEINTTLDSIDLNINEISSISDVKYLKQNYTVPYALIPGSFRYLTGDNSWTITTERGSVGTVDVGNEDGTWSLSEGLWYIRYQLEFEGTEIYSDGGVTSQMKNVTQGSKTITHTIVDRDLEKSIGTSVFTCGFYIKSIVGGIMWEAVDPNDSLSLQAVVSNNLNEALTPSTSSYIQFVYVRSL